MRKLCDFYEESDAPRIWSKFRICDEDLKDWIWTLVQGKFTMEEIDGFLVKLNANYASAPQADRFSIIAQVFIDFDPLEIEELSLEEQESIDRVLQELRKKGYGIW